MHLFWLDNVMIRKTESSASTSRGKKSRSRGKLLCKMNYLKVISFKSSEESSAQVKNAGSPSEVQMAVPVKKEAAPVKKKNPRLKSTTGIKDPPKATSEDLMRPMPYNEKLRRGGGENSRAIAETQVSRLEVLRGRYRKEPTVYPYRRVASLPRQTPGDREPVSGRCLLRRSYATSLTGQDRLLAEMAVRSGGSLHLSGHNIHVVPSKPARLPTRRSNRNITLSESTVNIKQEEEEEELRVEVEMDLEIDASFLQEVLEMELNKDPSPFNELHELFDFDEKYLDIDCAEQPTVQPPEENIDDILDSILQFEDALSATF